MFITLRTECIASHRLAVKKVFQRDTEESVRLANDIVAHKSVLAAQASSGIARSPAIVFCDRKILAHLLHRRAMAESAS